MSRTSSGNVMKQSWTCCPFLNCYSASQNRVNSQIRRKQRLWWTFRSENRIRNAIFTIYTLYDIRKAFTLLSNSPHTFVTLEWCTISLYSMADEGIIYRFARLFDEGGGLCIYTESAVHDVREQVYYSLWAIVSIRGSTTETHKTVLMEEGSCLSIDGPKWAVLEGRFPLRRPPNAAL